jgi:ketosteroid isomerase-like protein
MSNTDVVRAAFAAYRAQDRAAAEQLIGEDFVFSSPQDDHVDRPAYFGDINISAGVERQAMGAAKLPSA